MEKKDERIMEVALTAGHILLENGAEISRVEETIDRICKYYGVESGNAFVLSNGIFVTAGSTREEYFAKVQHIPVSAIHLDRIAAVNQLSREISDGKWSIDGAEQELERIRHMPGKKKWTRIAASGIGSGAFCLLFGGSMRDMTTAMMAGFLLYIFLLVAEGKMTKIVLNILGGALVTSFCSIMYLLGIGEHLNFMIIGSIMPLVPGVAFTNSIRDIADGDYISGSVRMLDALLVFFSIAIGVGMTFSFIGTICGGFFL